MSTVESDSFRFTGIDVKKTETGIEISMEDYAQSLEDINIREAKADEELTREELKIFRKYVGKLNWLATNTRPDLAIYALDLAKKQKKAVIKDLREINRILKKVREKESKVVFSRIGRKEDLCVLGISDASYHCSDRSVAGEMILLGNLGSDEAVPIYWRSGVIRKVCISPKAAETRALLRVTDDSVHMARQISELLNTRIEVKMFTDSRPLLESIGSSGQIEEKALRQSVACLKQALEDEEVKDYAWIQGEEIVADVLTKQGSTREALDEIIKKNKFRNAHSQDNRVTFEGNEFKIRNRTTKKDKKEEDEE